MRGGPAPLVADGGVFRPHHLPSSPQSPKLLIPPALPMAEPKSSAPARALPTVHVGLIRRVLTVGGIAFAVLNVGLMVSGTAGSSGPTLAAALWGAAAVCFLGAFVAYMMEPVTKLEGATPTSTATDASAVALTAEGAANPDAGKPADSGDTAHAPLLRRGNPLRWTRGGITTLLGMLFTILLMAKQGQWRWGVPLGAISRVHRVLGRDGPAGDVRRSRRSGRALHVDRRSRPRRWPASSSRGCCSASCSASRPGGPAAPADRLGPARHARIHRRGRRVLRARPEARPLAGTRPGRTARSSGAMASGWSPSRPSCSSR